MLTRVINKSVGNPVWDFISNNEKIALKATLLQMCRSTTLPWLQQMFRPYVLAYDVLDPKICFPLWMPQMSRTLNSAANLAEGG